MKYETMKQSHKQLRTIKSARAVKLPTNAKAPIVFKTRTGKLTDVERTHWPRLGNIKDGDVKGHEFDDKFLEHYTPGDEAIGYVAGCSMLRECARVYHLPLAKAGWSQLPDLLSRQDDLNTDHYGGWRREDGKLVKETGCYWEMQRSNLTFALHANSPVRLVPRGIGVRLPIGYEFRAFEKHMHAAMRRSSLATFANAPEGRAHFAKLGIEASDVPRYTVYGFGSGQRTNPAHEIYIMRPRADFSRIVIIAERLVLAHVERIAATHAAKGGRSNVIKLRPVAI